MICFNCDIDLAANLKRTMFNFAAHRRPEHYRTDRPGRRGNDPGERLTRRTAPTRAGGWHGLCVRRPLASSPPRGNNEGGIMIRSTLNLILAAALLACRGRPPTRSRSRPASTAPSRRTPCRSSAAASRASTSTCSPRSASARPPDRDRGRRVLGPDPRLNAKTLRLRRRADHGDEGACENLLFTEGYLKTDYQFLAPAGKPTSRRWTTSRARRSRQQGLGLRDVAARQRGASTASSARSTAPTPTPCRPCCRAAPTPRWAATRWSPMRPSRTRQAAGHVSDRRPGLVWARRVPQGRCRQLRNAVEERSSA